jgi:hypothetical protein
LIAAAPPLPSPAGVEGRGMKKITGTIISIGIALTIPLETAAHAATPAKAPTPAATSAEAPLDPECLALAHQILAVAFPADRRSDMMASVMDAIIEQARKNTEALRVSDDKDFQSVVDRSIQRMNDEMKASVSASVPDYFASFERAYARDFSREDLEAILAFVKTPAGRHYFERSPNLLKDPDVQAAGQRMTAKLLAQLPEINGELIHDVQDYVAKKKQGEKAAVRAPVT